MSTTRYPRLLPLPALRPLAAALIAAGLSAPATALDHVWFGGIGSWDTPANWSPSGPPGATDVAIFGGGSATLSFASAVSQLHFQGGTLSGPGTLAVADTFLLTGIGPRSVGGGLALDIAGNTLWSGNTAAGGNAFNINGSATIRNTGAWTDANGFDATLGFGSAGTKLFDNSGSYTKAGSGISDLYVAFNNTGTVNVTAGRLSLVGNVDSRSTGHFEIAGGAVLAFGRGGSSGGLATLDGVSFGGTGQLLIDASNSASTDVLLASNAVHAGTLAVANGALAVDSSFSVAAFAQTGGILRGTGTTLVDGDASFNGGSQVDAGSTRFNAALTLGGNGSRSLGGGRVFITAGDTLWSGNASSGGNAFNINGSATIRNTGAWTDANGFDTTLGFGSAGTKLFDNSGSYTKAGSGISDLYVAFNNTGTVNVTAGRLSLVGNVDSRSTGHFEIAGGAVLAFGRGGSSSGLATLDGVSFGGTGQLLIDASNSASTDVLLASNAVHAGTLAVANGALAVDSSFSVAAFAQTGGILRGTGTTLVDGDASFNGGSQVDAGSTRFNAALTLGGNGSRSLGGGRVFITAGNTLWSGNASSGGNAFDINGSATIRNTGTWTDANGFDATLGFGSAGTKLFDNGGSYTKAGSGISDLYVAFNNTGTVNVTAGRLSLVGNVDSRSTGHFEIAGGAVLAFGRGGSSSGLATLDGVSFGGTGQLLIDASNSASTDVLLASIAVHAGTLAVANGALAVDSSFSVAAFAQTGGILRGTGTTLVDGDASFNGGSQLDAGSTRFNAALTLGGNGSRSLGGGRVFITAGNTLWSGNASSGGNAFDINGSATIRNTGTWTDANGFDTTLGFGSAGTKLFDNSGSYTKAGGGISDVYATFDNTGVIDVQKGALRVQTAFDNRGLLRVASSALLHGNAGAFTNSGRLQGNGTVRTATNGTLLNRGTIAPGDSTGTLTLDGDLSMAATGRMQFELGSTADFDRLVISDDATFAGTLEVLGLGFTPVLGDSFTIITFDQRLADSRFDGLSWSGFGPDVAFTATYNLHDVTLTVTAVPEPGAWAMLLAGLGVVGTIARRRVPAA